MTPTPTEPAPTGPPDKPSPWRLTLHLVAVLVFGIVAVVARADRGVVIAVGLMVCAVLGWKGPVPTIVIGSRSEDSDP